MKSLGLSIQETAIINAVIPVLFIFTPPIAGFLADKIGNFRVLLSLLTGTGGLVSLLLLLVPVGRDISLYPDKLTWGLTCGAPGSRAQYQNLMVHGFNDDKCQVTPGSWENATFTPGTCGYMCPTRSRLRVAPKFFEYKVVWPNRGGGFGITEIVDVVNLEKIQEREYHEPRMIDSNIFFPMNWTFHLNCDRIRSDDCIFNPILNSKAEIKYNVNLTPLQMTIKKTTDHVHQEFIVSSIQHPQLRRPVSRTINCGSKSEIAQVVSTVSTGEKSLQKQFGDDIPQLIDTKLNDCTLTCLVNFERENMCNNTSEPITHSPVTTFWTYMAIRTALGVLTASSLMMFEGAVMATIQELGGDYGLQRFVGNFGAIVFAPMGGFLIDASSIEPADTDFSPVVYVYLALKLVAAFMILFIRLDFKPPGEKILSNLKEIVKNAEVMVFLLMMMFAGIFWGYIEGFLFWYLDDLGASKLEMGWTVTIGMITSLPFLVFSGPITEVLGHVNVIIIGMLAYFVRLLGYSFIKDPMHVYPFESLEGFTMALMMTSAVTYVAKISTPTTIASVMGLMGSLFFGVGKGSGCLFGGLLMSYIGSVWTYRVFAIVAAVCAAFYIVFQTSLNCSKRGSRKISTQLSTDQLTNDEVDVDAKNKFHDPDLHANIISNSNNSINTSTHNINQQPDGHSVLGGLANGRTPSLLSLNQQNSLGNGPRSLTGGTRV